MVQMAQYFHSKLHTILVHNPWRAVLCAGMCNRTSVAGGILIRPPQLETVHTTHVTDFIKK
jgi:hypothetical protein